MPHLVKASACYTLILVRIFALSPKAFSGLDGSHDHHTHPRDDSVLAFYRTIAYYQRTRVPRLLRVKSYKIFWGYSTRLCLRHIGDVSLVLSKMWRNLSPKHTNIPGHMCLATQVAGGGVTFEIEKVFTRHSCARCLFHKYTTSRKGRGNPCGCPRLGRHEACPYWPRTYEMDI